MNHQEMKKIINNEFGFAITKIVLLEGSKNSFGEYDYIMFLVCGIRYTMSFNYVDKRYNLSIFDSNGRIK